MSNFREVVSEITVPKNTGIEGFLHTIRTVLKLPHVTTIKIDSNGKVECRRYTRDTDPPLNIGVDFEDIAPMNVIRNTHVQEVLFTQDNAAASVCRLFDVATQNQMTPIGLVTGTQTVLWQWFKRTTSLTFSSDAMLFGIPVYYDKAAPDTALILVVGYGRDASLFDGRISYKLELPVLTYKDEVEDL